MKVELLTLPLKIALFTSMVMSTMLLVDQSLSTSSKMILEEEIMRSQRRLETLELAKLVVLSDSQAHSNSKNSEQKAKIQ